VNHSTSEQSRYLHTPMPALIHDLIALSHVKRTLAPEHLQRVDRMRAELRRRELIGVPVVTPPITAEHFPGPTICVTATPAPNGREWVLRFPCPWCRWRFGRPIFHEHPGGPTDDEPAFGWRTSHCPQRGKRGAPDSYAMVVRREDEPPIAFVKAEWSERSQSWAITVLRCPFCGRQHAHGGCRGPAPDLGFRAAHCVVEHGTYELVLDPALSPVGQRS
jgi:hypothetical protein